MGENMNEINWEKLQASAVEAMKRLMLLTQTFQLELLLKLKMDELSLDATLKMPATD